MPAAAPSPKKKPNSILRLTLFWAIVVFGALLIYALTGARDNLKDVALSDVINRANNGEISKIVIEGNSLTITPKGSDKPTERSTKDGAGTLYDQGLKPDAPVVVDPKAPSRVR